MKFSPLGFLIAGAMSLMSVRGAPPEVVVCQYNVRNYLNAQASGEGQKIGVKAKPEEEIAALIRIVKEINPDILGVCEMGTPDRFEDFKKRLAEAGLGYKDFEYVQAADADRHLALLSRYPIVARQSVTDLPFDLDGRVERVRRGFLDVTVQITTAYQLRLVGAHLKSKLPVPEGEALIRRHEAQELRKHLDAIFKETPDVNLVCYGDFNETKDQPAYHEITGVRGSPAHLTDVQAKDALGDRWTHFWSTADQYSRIDYILVSAALAREVVKGKSAVYRGPDWDLASDHRAVYASILPLDRK